jgi:hypothetical protein
MAIPPINLTDPFTTLVARTNEVIAVTNNSDSSVGSGGLASLTTDDKSSLVAAINEIVAFTYDSDFARGSSTLRTAIFGLVDSSYLKEDQINTTYLRSEIDEAYLQSQIDSTYLKGQIDETYLQSQIDSTYLRASFDSAFIATIPGLPTLGNFSLVEDSGVLYIKYNGVSVVSIQSDGEIKTADNITAFTTP